MMRTRILVSLLVIAVAIPAVAINTNRGDRVCVLQVQPEGPFDARIAQAIRDRLQHALRQRGFHTVETDAVFEDVRRTPDLAADYFVEVASANSAAYPTGAAAVGVGHVGIDVGMTVSRVGAVVRIYDGRTLELLQSRPLAREGVTVAPSGIGIGTYHASVWAPLPFAVWARERSMVRAVAQEAADAVCDISGFQR